MCRHHAEACIREYAEKLGETCWEFVAEPDSGSAGGPATCREGRPAAPGPADRPDASLPVQGPSGRLLAQVAWVFLREADQQAPGPENNRLHAIAQRLFYRAAELGQTATGLDYVFGDDV
jgi:hypothetical protein